MNYNDSYIDVLIQRCLDRTATAEERKVLLRVLKYTDNAQIEGKIVAAFQQKQVKLEPGNTVWAAIEKQIAEETPIRPIRRYNKGLQFVKYAAAVLLFLTIPLYFFRDALPPAVTELKLVREVSDIFKDQTPRVASEEFAEEIQLILSQDRKVNLLDRDSAALTNAEEYIHISRSDNQISYTLQDSGTHLMSSAVVYHTIKVPYGKRFSVRLIDGTLVSLNSGTELRYPINTQQQDMDLYLTGEAYFDVAKSQNRKFNVHVDGDRFKKEHMVQVLGTQFNIRAFPHDRQSVTTLYEGAIQVSGLTALPIRLQPSKQITVDQHYAIAAADLEMNSAWLNNVFYFKNTALDEACQELERWYGIKVTYNRGKETKKILAQISRNKSLKDVLDMLAQTYDIKYEFRGKEVILTD
ncbi:FecR family protein [Sphingobacterium tabacisoli]|uniref:FecR family protein n=1 Tax=Sphingobacterium tabacisoli TaxID=2044855 RepID=A0ABW5L763_9SPHI|nr:FecR family protein [Sphingobacterium tabacisoli]